MSQASWRVKSCLEPSHIGLKHLLGWLKPEWPSRLKSGTNPLGDGFTVLRHALAALEPGVWLAFSMTSPNANVPKRSARDSWPRRRTRGGKPKRHCEPETSSSRSRHMSCERPSRTF